MKSTQVSTPAPARSAEEWSRLVEEWQRARVTPAKFCRARGLSAKTFQWWRWALLTRGASPHRHSPLQPSRARRSLTSTRPSSSSPALPAFIEIVPSAPPSVSVTAVPRRPAGVEVVVPGRRGDRRVRVDVEFDATVLARVVTALEEV
jgi:hypothetical protein